MPICDFFKQQKRSPTLIRVPICNGILWCSLDYSDCINECFYDVWGSFEAELGAAKIFPSLTDLSRIPQPRVTPARCAALRDPPMDAGPFMSAMETPVLLPSWGPHRICNTL